MENNYSKRKNARNMKKIRFSKYIKEHWYCKVCSLQFNGDSIYDFHLKYVHEYIANGPIMIGNNSAKKEEDSKTTKKVENPTPLSSNCTTSNVDTWIENDNDQVEIDNDEILQTYHKLMLEK